MISATRIPLALSRDGYLPAFLSRIHPRLKTPLPAVLFSGGIIAVCAASSQEVFLGYIANFGYLYLLVFANLSIIWLRRKFPEQKRPFKVPFYPVFPLVAAGTCVLMGIFIEPKALAFGAGLLGMGLVVYQLRRPVSEAVEAAAQTVEAAHHEILVPVANPLTAESLIKMAVILDRAQGGINNHPPGRGRAARPWRGRDQARTRPDRRRATRPSGPAVGLGHRQSRGRLTDGVALAP